MLASLFLGVRFAIRGAKISKNLEIISRLEAPQG
jgi:hypothetical protein